MTVHRSVLGFGRAVLEARDLDPVYEALARARLEHALLCRVLLAYWWFYHLGLAAHVAHQRWFYPAAMDAFDTGLRGTERRHFRTTAARESLRWFGKTYAEPAAAVEALRGTDFEAVRTQVLQWPQFGPWMAFKVADMLERVLRWPLHCPLRTLQFYTTPRAGAALVCEEERLVGTDPVALAVAHVLHGLRGWQAPPHGDRSLGVAEAETVLCKYKSHRGGHYPVGKDRREVVHGLAAFGFDEWLPC